MGWNHQLAIDETPGIQTERCWKTTMWETYNYYVAM